MQEFLQWVVDFEFLVPIDGEWSKTYRKHHFRVGCGHFFHFWGVQSRNLGVGHCKNFGSGGSILSYWYQSTGNGPKRIENITLGSGVVIFFIFGGSKVEIWGSATVRILAVGGRF